MTYRYSPEEIGGLNSTIDSLRAEIERLRAALRNIDAVATNHERGGIKRAQGIARRALEHSVNKAPPAENNTATINEKH